MTPEDAAAVYEMRLMAELEPTYENRCIFGEKVYWVEAEGALAPGHIYSEDGMREYRRNSHCCEYHFDWMFADEDLVEL